MKNKIPNYETKKKKNQKQTVSVYNKIILREQMKTVTLSPFANNN